jgi:CBS domain-containing protein
MPKTLREEFPSVIDVAYVEYKKYKHVSDIMTTDVVLVEPGMNMFDAAVLMGERHIGSLLIAGDQRPSGIVTERDLLTRIIAANRDPKKVKVQDVMSPRLVTITPYISIKEAARTMIKERGRLVVLEDRNLAGIVTASDLIRSLPDAPETSTLVCHFMTKDVRMVSPYETVIDVAKVMGKERIGSVLVKKEGEPWGIFTERDLLTKVIYMGKSLEDNVEKYSSSPLIKIKPSCSVHDAARTMSTKHVRRLPVYDDGKIMGIITARDLVEAYSI